MDSVLGVVLVPDSYYEAVWSHGKSDWTRRDTSAINNGEIFLDEFTIDTHGNL